MKRHHPGRRRRSCTPRTTATGASAATSRSPTRSAALAPPLGLDEAALRRGHRQRRGAQRPARCRQGLAGPRRLRLAVRLRRRRAVLGLRPAGAARRLAEPAAAGERAKARAHEPLPLAGITVIDLSRVVAGPYCTQMLADLGATVIKVEHPSDPDYVRDFPPRPARRATAATRGSGYFAQYNRHKLGVSLDLKHPDGKALLLEMAARPTSWSRTSGPARWTSSASAGRTLQAREPTPDLHRRSAASARTARTRRGPRTTARRRPPAACGR